MKSSGMGKGEREVRLLVGKGGNGKTTMLRQLLQKATRAIVFDPLAIMYPGIVLTSRDELEHWIDIRGENPRFRLVYRPGIDVADRDSIRQEAEIVCWIGRQLQNVSLFFDELDTFCHGEDSEKRNPELTALLNMGRNFSVDIVGTVRRPQVKVPRDWITEATVIDIFATSDPIDCAFLERAVHGKIEAAKFPELVKFQFWEWRSDESVCLCTLKNPYNG